MVGSVAGTYGVDLGLNANEVDPMERPPFLSSFGIEESSVFAGGLNSLVEVDMDGALGLKVFDLKDDV